jgi:hypothetical protein
MRKGVRGRATSVARPCATSSPPSTAPRRPHYHFYQYRFQKYQLTIPLLCLLECRVIVEKHESKTMNNAMKTLMNRFPLWLAISNPSSMNLKNLLFALAASAVIAITAVGTDATPTADQRTTNAGPAGHWEADITGDGPQRIGVTLDLAKNAKSE